MSLVIYSLLLMCSTRFGVVLQPAKRTPPKTSRTKSPTHNELTENKMTDVVIQQHSRKLLMMDILMSETC